LAKYAALGEFLRKQVGSQIPMTFERIEKITGGKLPPSASRHRAWWSNNPDNSVMTKVWLDAGFQSEQVDMEGRRLVFRRIAPRGPKVLESDTSNGAGPPATSNRHPLFGWLKGTVRIAPGVDLTQPADPEWADRLDK